MLQTYSFSDPMQIVLGICTCKRPVLLTQCLISVQELTLPKNSALNVIIVDNDDDEHSKARDIVEAFQIDDMAWHPTFHFQREPQRSIARARNRILDFAIDHDAEWIVMLDDDQRVPRNWLTQMFIAQRAHEAEVVKSAVNFEYPTPLPFWAFPDHKDKKPPIIADHVATNGVLFSRAIIDKDGLKLRFNEKYGLSMGEDRDFFQRAKRLGTKIIRTPEATAIEVLPETKLTFGAQVARKFHSTWTNVRQDIHFDGKFFVLLDNLPKIFSDSFIALLFAAVGIITLPFTPKNACKNFLRSGKRLAKACGLVAGILSLSQPAPYRHVHGY